MNTGCFPGDAPGFPITISESGSYRLTSPLVVTTVPDIDGIAVAADGATIDLNGFEIVGRTSCLGSGSAISCSLSGTGSGIDANGRSGITVKDGTLRNHPNRGVIAGPRAEIRGVFTVGNAAAGISVGANSRVTGSVAHRNAGTRGIYALAGSLIDGSIASENRVNGIVTGTGSTVVASTGSLNGSDGIRVGAGSVVRESAASFNENDGLFIGVGSLAIENSVYSNGADGIVANGDASVQRNTVRESVAVGLSLAIDSAYRGNTLSDNTGGNITGGVDLGANACDGNAICP